MTEPSQKTAVCRCGAKIIEVPTPKEPGKYWRRDGTGEVCVDGHWHEPAPALEGRDL